MVNDAKPEPVLNCPFCGSEAVRVLAHPRGDAVMRLEEWNTRATEPKPCVWTCDEEGYWASSCGGSFTFLDDGPKENICCYCGGRLEKAK